MNTTPSYTFNSTEAGTLSMGGSCGTSSSTSVVAGNDRGRDGIPSGNQTLKRGRRH
jgi:hypothetical protein